ncbi:hypothetical protein EXN66_Car011317 [Channa argus]|uniref:Uncharacterized protein n=1 Tax=Channa argus TaxID=215402 RepID=A0A6G1PZ67_CHAAH|nr:hypothetical protein EXN66_Car011317 [Channa argus]
MVYLGSRLCFAYFTLQKCNKKQVYKHKDPLSCLIVYQHNISYLQRNTEIFSSSAGGHYSVFVLQACYRLSDCSTQILEKHIHNYCSTIF